MKERSSSKRSRKDDRLDAQTLGRLARVDASCCGPFNTAARRHKRI
jgi:hypothetical protein